MEQMVHIHLLTALFIIAVNIGNIISNLINDRTQLKKRMIIASLAVLYLLGVIGRINSTPQSLTDTVLRMITLLLLLVIIILEFKIMYKKQRKILNTMFGKRKNKYNRKGKKFKYV